jgi:hypothetical protein
MGKNMTIQHKTLAEGRWQKMSFCEQMANVGSEVSRALNWRKRGKPDLFDNAVIRALELLSLTIDCAKTYHRLRELCRVKEALLDFFYGSNEFHSSEILWRKYFDQFLYAVRKNY